jgi:2-polyprenyl-3-methyl-5-hydroxy-6-metoxy-1,4-benzoquinol methylase
MDFGLTQFQRGILFFLVILLINYGMVVYYDKYVKNVYEQPFEGFEDVNDKHVTDVKTEPLQIYDAFYAKIYNLLTQGEKRTMAKVVFNINYWKKMQPKFDISKWSILDAGCGTGIASAAFAKMGAGKVVAMDSSPAMIEEAKSALEKNKDLTDAQKEVIVFRNETMMNPSACSAGEFTHIIVYYFSIYYLQDKETFFRNAYMWTLPAGRMAVEVVNKYKFDPILDSANPLIGFSLQKYSKERITKSSVAFNTFDYDASFALENDKVGTFSETFRFKNGNVRRQKHMLYMTGISDIIKSASMAGWKYEKYEDLTTADFEYGYLLYFVKG